MPWLARLRALARELVSGERPALFVCLVLLAMFALATLRIRHDSPTEDEWAHLVRGVSYWQNRDMRVQVQHPPLANAIDAIPTIFDSHKPDTGRLSTWKNGYPPAGEYISADYAQARDELMRCRYVAVIFLVGLAWYVFVFCRTFFGWPSAAAALLLVAFNPTLIGQARYVATDLPAATMWMVAVGETIRYLVSRSIWPLLTMALGFSGALLVKHSGVVLIPLLTGTAFVIAVIGRARYSALLLGRRLLTWFSHFALAALIVLLSINAAYKFDRTMLTVAEFLEQPEQRHWTTSGYRGSFLERRTFLPKLPQNFRIPLPHPYLFGLFTIAEHNRRGYPTYFLGKSSQEGTPAYFPVLIVLKNPPALLALLALGIVIIVRVRRFRLSLPSTVVLAVSAGFLVVLITSNLNMGIRHALPIIPLLSVLAGRAFSLLPDLLSGAWLSLTRAVGLSSLLSALKAAPHFLVYFNILAFGRGSDIAVVGDDWGQDREDFVRFAQKLKLEPLYYYSETSTRKMEVDYLGLRFSELDCRTEPVPGAWVALHVQYVHRWEHSNCAEWLHGLSPTYVVNQNVRIYHLSSDRRPRRSRTGPPSTGIEVAPDND